MTSPIVSVITIAFLLFILVMATWFAWVVVGIRKIYYRMFKKRQINMVLDLLYDNDNNRMFKHERIDKYIKLGFHNPAIFDIAEELYYNQRRQETKLNAKEIKYEHTRQQNPNTRLLRQVKSFEVPYASESSKPTPSPARTGIGEQRAISQANASVEPRADTSYPARASANSQVAGQWDLQIGNVEKPSKKSRYFN